MEYTILILLLPLLSFLFLGLAGMKLKPVVAGAIGTAVLAVVALLSYCTAFEYFSAGRDASGVFPTLVPWNTVWLPISRTLHIDLGILLDPISVMMLVVISTVSLMVHVYSLGYIHDRRKGWYWFFLLLTFASLAGIVSTPDTAAMYGYWELMTFASYFLVVHEGRRTAYEAGLKYYVMCAGGALFSVSTTFLNAALLPLSRSNIPISVSSPEFSIAECGCHVSAVLSVNSATV